MNVSTNKQLKRFQNLAFFAREKVKRRLNWNDSADQTSWAGLVSGNTHTWACSNGPS